MVEINKIKAFNEAHLSEHNRSWDFLAESLTRKGVDLDPLIKTLGDFQIAIPSWALGTGELDLEGSHKGENPPIWRIKLKT